MPVLRTTDAMLGGRFSEKRVAPHLAAEKTLWQSLEFSFAIERQLYELAPTAPIASGDWGHDRLRVTFYP
jgi:hypothetical protein